MKYRTGLVVGKFSPLHYGHEYLIGAAMQQCEKVIVLSYTDPEFKHCEAAERRKWFAERFPTVQALVIEPGSFDLGERGRIKVPTNDASENLHREFCGTVLLEHLETTVDAVFSSEQYGPGFADHLTEYFWHYLKTSPKVESVVVDEARTFVPISGTAIRNDRTLLPSYTSEIVRRSFMKRIVILGGESSGKTTLAKALAKKLTAPYVAEYGRTFCETLQDMSFVRYEDLEHIAVTHVRNEESAAERQFGNSGFVICDTSPLTSAFYSLKMFDRVSKNLRDLSNRKYDYTFICDSNIPFEYEPGRIDPAFRDEGFKFYLEWHNKNNRPYTIVSGTVEERVQQILEILNGSNEASAAEMFGEL